MTSDYLLIAASIVTAVSILSLASLRGWQGWLQLKTRELDLHRPEIEGGAVNRPDRDRRPQGADPQA